MSVQAILEDLEKIAASIAERSSTQLQTGADVMSESLLKRGMDSLDFIDYLLAIEEKYGFRVSEEDIESQALGRTPHMAEFLARIIQAKKV